MDKCSICNTNVELKQDKYSKNGAGVKSGNKIYCLPCHDIADFAIDINHTETATETPTPTKKPQKTECKVYIGNNVNSDAVNPLMIRPKKNKSRKSRKKRN